jgi:hypothetical protein
VKNRVKWVCGIICLSLVSMIAVAFLFRVAILTEAGRFMAPGGDYAADIAILEGNDFIDRGLVKSGMNLLSSGKVKRLIVVLFRIAPLHRPFALNDDYPSLVKKEMEALGLKERDFSIVVTHIHNPQTLIAANGAMEAISKENVKSAILVSEGFHARRSYLVYQHVSVPYKITIYPSASFNSYQLDHWWSQDVGLREFAVESLKLAYYLVRGYIPLKLS